MGKRNVEEIKEESNYLRGTLARDLEDGTSHFDHDGYQLLKFHGMYQQDDRDARKERKKHHEELLYFFMVRSKIPGGKLTAEQYLVHDDLCERYGNGTLRLTSRQGIQMHGVLKHNLKSYLRELNAAMVSTLAACGDVERNVMCCPAPIRHNSVRDEMQALATRIAEHLCPQTTAYHEIWLNGEKTITHKQGEDVEPIYGRRYLPRKFKTGIALPEDNCIDVLSNDLGLLVKHNNGSIEGYNVFVGGGMGQLNSRDDSYPRLATPLCFASPDEILDVVTAVVKVQRDFGDREDRHQARMKYLIDKWGQQKFHDKVQEYFGKPLAPYAGDVVTDVDDHLGWNDQGDGKVWRGVHVVSGRVKDTPELQLRTALRKIVSKYRPAVRTTANQDILLCDLDPSVKADVDAILREHGVTDLSEISDLMRHAMACPAVPTCGLALAESERVFAKLIGSIETEMAQLGLSRESITLHMTGCPNGCARPYNAEIGIVGRSPGKYTLYLGGSRVGAAMATLYQDLVPFEDIPNVLRGPLLFYKQARHEGEEFGAFCRRIGIQELQTRAGEALGAK